MLESRKQVTETVQIKGNRRRTMHLKFVALLLLSYVRNAASNSCSEVEVLILGAGASGIGAAHTLFQAGVTNFTVLEAKDRIGGRVHQITKDGMKIEMGAAWSHERGKKNSINKLLEKYNMKMVEGKGAVTYIDANTSTKYPITESDKAQDKIEQAISTMDTLIEERVGRKESDLPLSVGLAYGGWMPSTHLEKAVNWFNFDYENALSNEGVSAYMYGQTATGIDMLITDERGYAYIFDKTAEPFKEKVLLKKVVTTVTKLNETRPRPASHQSYKVDVQDGSCYMANDVLITFSSHVLGSGRILFDPELPSWKKLAFVSFPQAHYCKIYLKFPSAFWDDAEYIMAVSNDVDDLNLWLNLNKFKPGSNLLLGTLVGERCLQSQNDSDTEVQQDAMRVLKSIYKESIPEPVDIIRSNWSVDPHFGGAFSYPVTGISDNDWKAVKHSVGRIWFAGEYTAGEYFGYVHGAYDSGIERANGIMKCRKNKEDCPKPFAFEPKCPSGAVSSTTRSLAFDVFIVTILSLCSYSMQLL